MRLTSEFFHQQSWTNLTAPLHHHLCISSTSVFFRVRVGWWQKFVFIFHSCTGPPFQLNSPAQTHFLRRRKNLLLALAQLQDLKNFFSLYWSILSWKSDLTFVLVILVAFVAFFLPRLLPLRLIELVLGALCFWYCIRLFHHTRKHLLGNVRAREASRLFRRKCWRIT